MLLSCRILRDVSSVNSFKYATEASFTEGDGATVYFQLVDKSKRCSPLEEGLRYVPDDGATLEVTIDSIDNAKKLTRFAVQPYDGDKSIWAFTFMPSDTIRGTASIRLKLTEGNVIVRGVLVNCISIWPKGAV